MLKLTGRTETTGFASPVTDDVWRACAPGESAAAGTLACLVPAGQEVTPTLLLRLRGLADRGQFKEPFRVQVPV